MMNINSPIRIFLVFSILFPVYSQDTFEEFLKQQQQAQQAFLFGLVKI